MKRSIVYAGVAVAAAILAIAGWRFAPRDDFAFLRPFHPKDERIEMTVIGDSMMGSGGIMKPEGTGAYCRYFTFPESSPALLAVLHAHSDHPEYGYATGRVDVVLANGRRGFFDSRSRTLMFYSEPGPSWLEAHWSVWRKHLGL